MRVVFFGTPDFAVPTLLALLAEHDVALVVTQPDRRAGRGMGMRPSAVAERAAAAGVPMIQPERARDPEVADRIRRERAEIIVVAAYGQILPPAVLDAARHGAVNVHASLLPRWRGASPVAAAILAGDETTGVSIMRMDAGLDTGPVLLQRSTQIAAEDTTGSLTPRLAELGADALLETLELVAAGRAEAVPQPAEGVTHAARVRKSDGDLEWSRPAGLIERALRAYNPWPGVRLPIGGDRVRVLGGRVMPAWVAGDGASVTPGTVLESSPQGLLVATGDSPFLVTDVQPPGKRPMAAADWARGHRRLALKG
jgi:methionyl-tRNA formyltransferase